MKSPRFSLAAYKDPAIVELIGQIDHKILAVWAIDCAERVLPFFERDHPQDRRPRQAIDALQKWIATGVFKMAVIRKASLDSHTAARDVGEDNPARSAARAAGQAVATAHVPLHALGAANYALQAIFRNTAPEEAETALAKERDWQIKHLLSISNR